MRNVLLVPALLVLAACQSPDLTAYHHRALHPVEVREGQLRMVLGDDKELAVGRARQFAAQRPNNGSSFVVSAEPTLAEAVRAAIVSAGVDPRDVQVAPQAGTAELTRIDRFASVANCSTPPTRQSAGDYAFRVDDGWRHDNSNSTLLGCSVRNNVVQMTDDPRTLAGPVHNDGHDGARAAEQYQKWVKGQPTYSNSRLPTWSTSSTNTGGSQ